MRSARPRRSTLRSAMAAASMRGERRFCTNSRYVTTTPSLRVACQYTALGCSNPQSIEIHRGVHGSSCTCSARTVCRRGAKISKYCPA